MALKTKVKAANVRVPQNRDEAAAMIAEHGRLVREIARIELAMNDDLAAIKAEAVRQSAPLQEQSDALVKGITTFCEANRVALTDNNKTKTIDFGTGTVSWRHNPPAVNTRGKVDDIIDRIKALISGGNDAYKKFLRPAVTINRAAMLNDPELAKTIVGIKINSAGETFTIEPFADETLPEAVQ
ncbi:host-nuclease inhibitor protein Gam [Afipia sp. P52-10]|uniref:host-nuclease inhibitor Gam family protein n=1 Tax=Afipia sp. P52-10 TaxID=1429916 RepID=UPI0003DF4678|nr:host-nuclease inhibitor Gam family protein [Afipia sp. P52-10]ETR78888.1 host-nuclease inhibitor protein Gam [Afipia sp. P52-10]